MRNSMRSSGIASTENDDDRSLSRNGHAYCPPYIDRVVTLLGLAGVPDSL